MTMRRRDWLGDAVLLLVILWTIVMAVRIFEALP